MPTTSPFDTISLDVLTKVSGGCGGCKKQKRQPPPQPTAAPAPSGGPEVSTSVDISYTQAQ